MAYIVNEQTMLVIPVLLVEGFGLQAFGGRTAGLAGSIYGPSDSLLSRV